MNIEILKKALETSWDIDTCYDPMKKDYSKNKKSYGQCYPTALIVNDFFGGKILEYEFPEGWGHYSNFIDDKELDLTKDQFDSDQKFPKPKIKDRKDLKDDERYKILKKRVLKFLNDNDIKT
jgi:hypothetical protein